MVKRIDKRVKKINNKKKSKKLLLSGSIILNDFNKKILLLYREDYEHYETPGGKVELNKGESLNEDNLWRNAFRELKEELGEQIEVLDYEYFAHTSFILPNNKKGVAHKFIVHIDGIPRVNEPETFSKLDWVPISELHDLPISSDLKLMLEKVKMINE